MTARVQKWGNSLALRIPKSFALEASLTEDSPVELSLVDGSLVIRRLSPQHPTLEELLAGVTSKNLHGEWSTGAPVGREVL